MSKESFKCRNCGTTKLPIAEPCYDEEVDKFWISGWRAECLGRNEGLNCYNVSPYYVSEEDAYKYGSAYLMGVFVE